MAMTVCPGSCSPAGAEEVSLYEAVSGRAAVAAAVGRFCGRPLADPAPGPFLPGDVGARRRAYVVTVPGEALGGPGRYLGPGIAGAHRGLGIGVARFERTAADLAATAMSWAFPAAWPAASPGSRPGSSRPSRPRGAW